MIEIWPIARVLLAAGFVAVAFLVCLIKMGVTARQRHPDPAAVMLCLFLLFLAITALLWVPVVEALNPVLAACARSVTTVAYVLFALLATVYVEHGSAVRALAVTRIVAGALAVLAVLGTLMAVLSPANLGDPLVVVSLGYMGIASVVLAVRLRDFASHVQQRQAVAFGLRTAAVGFLVGVLYAAAMVVHGVLRWAGLVRGQQCTDDGPFLPCGLQFGLALLTLLAVSVGVVSPVISIAFARLRRTRQHHLSYRRLEPLWRTMQDNMPQISLTSTTSPRGGPARWEVEACLYRRWVEIRDGLLLLHRYRDVDERGVEHVDPVAEARSVMRAIDAYHAGQVVARTNQVPRTEDEDEDESRTDAYDADIEWLVQVSEALSRMSSRNDAYAG